MRGRIFAFAAVSILLMGGVAALGTGHQEAVRGANDANDINDTWNVSTNYSQLATPGNDGATYSAPEGVTVVQNGTTYAQSGNWTWDSGDARIKALSGSQLTTGEDATVSYAYFNASAAQGATQDISMIPLGTLAEAWPFILGLVLLLGAGAIFAGRA